MLLREGWTRTSVKEGDEVTIDGAVAKDGSKRCSSRTVVLNDGRKVFAGSSEDNAPVVRGGKQYENACHTSF